jgi:4-hydroxybenzoate polyprenyltransferase
MHTYMFITDFRVKLRRPKMPAKSKVRAYVKLLRFESWQAWLFNFLLGCILFELPTIERFTVVLVAFLLAASAVFILNQYFDYENDRENSLKKDLPIASGEVPPRTALTLFFVFTSISLTSAFLTDISVFVLLLAFMLLGIGYSTPPVCFKSRAGWDVIVCGIGAGVLPFLIGAQSAPNLTMEFEYFWIVRRYQDVFFTAIPIFLIQCAGQIYQVVGDYEADALAEINTFAVKYGKKTALRFATATLLFTITLPIIYELLNLSLIPFLEWYLVAFAFLVPCLLYFMKRTQDASAKNFKKLRDFARRAGTGILLVLIIYVFVVRIVLKGI